MDKMKNPIIFIIVLYLFLLPARIHAINLEDGLSLGYKAYKEGDFEKAVEHLESASKDDSIVSDYSLYYLGEAYLASDRFDDALNAFNACINYIIKSPLSLHAMERMGDTYMAKGDIEGSITIYRYLLSKYQDNAQTPLVLSKLISILLSGNRKEEAAPFIKRLLIEFPQAEYPHPQILSDEIKKLNAEELHARAKAMLKAGNPKRAADELEGYFEGLPWFHNNISHENILSLRLSLGQAFYQARNYKKAKEIFKHIFSRGDDNKARTDAFIWLARTYIRMKDFKSARNVLNTFIAMYTDNTNDINRGYRDEAIYRLSLIAMDEGDTELAITLLKQLLAENPVSSYKNDAIWKIGWIYYSQRNMEESIEALKALENSPLRMRALYWQGKIYLTLGRRNDAIKSLTPVADSFPPTYYSAMAQGMLERLSDFRPQTAEFIAKTRNNKPEIQDSDSSVSIKRVKRLLELGLNSLALKELSTINQRVNPMAISLLYREAGDIYHSYLTARNQPYNSQNFAYHLAFPEGHKELVEMTADKNGLDPFLIYAVMMQESEFDEKSVSSAGAIGLLQIMPNTGEMIAQRLSRQQFKNDDLFEPPVNIGFGAWYLKTLIIKFNGDLPLAIAAYNAGPNAVDDWIKKWGKADLDELVENIPYQETRKYVEKVLGYYEVYKAIYNNHTYILTNQTAQSDE